MYPAMLMPGASRLRALHPLMEKDGQCALIYDLERAAVFEVPSDLQPYIGSVLDRGDLDEAVLGWLVHEDLLTSENQGGWAERPAAADSLLGLENPGWKGTSLRWQEEFQARIENSERGELESILPLVFRHAYGVRMVRICFDWRDAFPGTSTLGWALREARAFADAERMELGCELKLSLGALTPELVEGLANLPLQVRLVARSGAGEDGAPRDEKAGRLGDRTLDKVGGWIGDPKAEGLLEKAIRRLEDRLTLEVAGPVSGLRGLWEWAQGAGLRRLDLGPAQARGESDLRIYGRELAAICDDILAGLADGKMPCDFEPLTRLVSRLRRSEPLGGDVLELGSPSVWLSRKEVGGAGGPGLAMEGLSPFDPSDFADDFEPLAASDGSACRSCWARQICGHSTFVASPTSERNGLGPSSGGCARWRAEAEAAVRFYHLLAQTDPIQALRFFEELPHGVAAPLDPRDGSDFSRVPF